MGDPVATFEEIAELRARLAEKEAALAALLRGDADAGVDESGVVSMRGAERPYQTFFDAMSEGGLTLDSSGRILHWNLRFESLIEIAAESLRGMNLLELVKTEDRDRLAGLLAAEKPIAAELTLVTPGGHSRPVLMSFTTIEAGALRATCVVVTDLRTQRANVLVLMESETKFRLLAEQATDCIFWVDANQCFKYVSPASLQIYGHAPEEFIADPGLMLRLIHPDDQPRYRKHIDECTAVGSAINEFRFRRRDGEMRWLEHHCHTLHDECGCFIGQRGCIRDITQRKADRDLIRKLSLAVEQDPSCIVITDMRGNIEYVNEAFVQVAGYSRDEVIGKNSRILQSGKTPIETYRAMWFALTRGEGWKGEFINRRKDGREYIEAAVITPLRQPDGSVTHFVGVKKDVTEKRRLRAELDGYRMHLEEMIATRTIELAAAKEAAEAANRAKSTFLANMSHEIRTPLNGILGMAHIMRRGDITPLQSEQLDKIEASGKHLLAVISDILDLSKIEAGRMQLESADFNLAAIFANVASVVGEAARLKGLRVESEVGTVPVWLRGDATRLQQALLNYAGNAVKFTSHGVVTLRARVLEDSGSELLLRFEVADTGIGIRNEKVPRLFHDFEQADSTIARQYGGTGLGLAITDRIAQLMGGKVGVDSVAGLGSTFWLTARLQRGEGAVPVAIVTDAADNVEELLRRHCSGARLLLAEDDPVSREVALILLRETGLTVDTAADGAEALAKARTMAYDLVLMDMQMPGMNGLEATRAIRALPGWESIPIVAMTANAFEDDRLDCEAAGMSDFVPKPVDPQRLNRALLKWLSAAEGNRNRRATEAAPVSAVMQKAGGVVPPPITADLMRSLAGVSSLNTERGLSLVCGNEPQYVRLLALFVECHGQDSQRLAAGLASTDSSDIRTLAHTLKGAATSIGASAVAEAATRLDATIREGAARPDVEVRCATLAAELGTLLDSLRGVLHE
jgi:two-component system sensor histidine kinase/response regulator